MAAAGAGHDGRMIETSRAVPTSRRIADWSAEDWVAEMRAKVERLTQSKEVVAPPEED